MYKNLNDYLDFLREEYGLDIKYLINKSAKIIIFDVNNMSSKIYNDYHVEILYNSIVGKEGFEVNCPALQLKEKDFNLYIETLQTAIGIAEKLNHFLSFYFF